MSQYFQVHPANPQRRLVRRTVEILRAGEVIAYPTDSCYALGCLIGEHEAMERIRRLRRLDEQHHFTLMCRDLSELASYARVDNSAYRLLRATTPGPFTFILRATREVPRRLQHPRRKTIGLRVPAHPTARALLEALGEPLMSTTLMLPGESMPLSDPGEIRERLDSQVGLVLDAGACGLEPSTVIDLTEEPPRLVRRGLGDPALVLGG